MERTSQSTTENLRGEISLLAHHARIAVQTKQQNLTDFDPRLAPFIEPSDCFHIQNLTEELKRIVREAGIVDGILTAQILHTSATLVVNELDEPMLLTDLMRKIRLFAPKSDSYLHNSPMRTVNLCDDDSHCDRNGDAHVKSTLFGHPSVTLIVREGRLVLGQWQKVALIEFDGPRPREVLVQVLGTG
ncbi:MAG TPA: secondary thiamine-phosphate synthase enzyme YjbQ [bacterium]|nr:secondary thiamine-phosphate synthase enzyme YjbQ [bacterium]